MHTCFNQAVAATGRLSSSDPNLQNIPIRTELGREIRRAFIAEPGTRAHLGRLLADRAPRARAPRRTRRCSSKRSATATDIHDRTALKVFGADSGLDPHELRGDREDRQLRAALREDRVHAGEGHRRHASRPRRSSSTRTSPGFPRVRAFIDRTLEERARHRRRARRCIGRRRLVPELTSRNGQMRAAAEREAVNMPIQGTAADIMKRAMIDVHAALAGSHPDARMILTVHDELLFEVPEKRAEAIAGARAASRCSRRRRSTCR